MKDAPRIGLFGGSFDPVHVGHIKLAQAAVTTFRLDRVIFIPARRPPHKLHKHLATGRDRVRMLTLALKTCPRFRVSYFELRRPSTTYTYQTIRHFRERFPRAELYFIIGSDSLAELPTWKRSDALLSSCRFIVGKRRGGPRILRKMIAPSVAFASRTLPAVSSSEIRRRVREGRPIVRLVPPAVGRYIRDHKLYRP